MEKSNFLLTYLLTLSAGLALTVLIMVMLNKGIKKYFSVISPDPEISGFFTKLTLIILFLGGTGAAISARYNTGDDSNWLTLAWDATAHIKEPMQQLFITLLILSVAFAVLLIIDKRTGK
ncbi:MAG TPA: hypothetical protein VI583_02430 [Cyclobacteriaceae bacterium]|nr:hypothetical protein [Cyclobacteriaceae bacterium]